MALNLGNITLAEQLLVSYGLGTAAGPAIAPFAQLLANEAWTINAIRPPDAIYLAQGVAQGQVDPAWAAGRASEQGFDQTRFDAMVSIANVGPALGYAFQAWRRGNLSDAQFQTALKRTGLEDQWFAALEALKGERLDLGAIATAVHRGIMSDAGLLVTPVPGGGGKVPRIPQSPLDTLAEFAAQGIDPERARVLVADTGLPLALGEMLQLLNRGEVTATDVKVSIAESNVRNEYMDVALALARRLLTPHEYAEAELRGVVADGSTGAALSGLNDADYRILYGILGRPISVKQITTGLARGGKYDPNATDYSAVPAGPYRDAVRRSAVRPEFAELDYANRYTYPSAFVLRTLAQAGELGNAAAVQQVLEEIGWPPALAKQVATAWVGAGTAGAVADPHVAKAQTQLWATAHRSYLAGEADAAAMQAALPSAGVAAGAIPAVLAVWDVERELVRKQLTPAQLKKAYKGADTNPATGAPWTLDEAIARLVGMGYSHNDAVTFLEE